MRTPVRSFYKSAFSKSNAGRLSFQSDRKLHSRSKSKHSDLSPSLEAAKAILSRANNLVQMTKSRLAGITLREDLSDCSDNEIAETKGVPKNSLREVIYKDESPTPQHSKVKGEDKCEDEDLSVESIMKSLHLEEYLPVIVENKIMVEDLLLLTKDDIKELGLPIYARNRILAFQKYFRVHREVPEEALTTILKEMYAPALIDAIQKSKAQPLAKQSNVCVSMNVENSDIQNEIRDFQREYKKVQVQAQKENVNTLNMIKKISEKHKEQLARYKADIQSIIGVIKH